MRASAKKAAASKKTAALKKAAGLKVAVPASPAAPAQPKMRKEYYFHPSYDHGYHSCTGSCGLSLLRAS